MTVCHPYFKSQRDVLIEKVSKNHNIDIHGLNYYYRYEKKKGPNPL
jgi:hypothetical protein